MMHKDALEQARKKLLAHAPANPSPLRRRVSSRTILAARLAATSLNDNDQHDIEGKDDGNECEEEGGENLEAYRARVQSVFSSSTPQQTLTTPAAAVRA